MPRLRHERTGVVVNVDDVTAAGLGPEWGDPETTQADDGIPRGNASREVWAAYADSLGVEYAPESKRAEIKAAIAAAEDAGADDDPDDDSDD